MKNLSSRYSRFERFSLWLLSKKSVVQGLIFGGFSFVTMTVVTAMIGLVILSGDTDPNPHNTYVFSIILYVSSAIIPSLIFAFVTPVALKLATDRLTRVFGFIPTPQEQIDVRAWFSRGVEPQSERVIAVLPTYLSHVEPYVTGRYLYPYKWLGVAMFILFMFNVIVYGAKIIIGFSVSGFDIYFFVFSLLFAFATVPIKFKNGNPLVRFMNRRNLTKYNRRKSELGV